MFNFHNVYENFEKMERKVENIMATLNDLDTILADIATGVDALIAKLNVSSAPPPPPPAPDVSAEVTSATAIKDKIDGVLNPPNNSSSGGVTVQTGA